MEFDIQYQLHKIPSWSEYYFEYQELDYILNKYFKRSKSENGCVKNEEELNILERGNREQGESNNKKEPQEIRERDGIIEMKQKSDSIKRSYSILEEDQPLNLKIFKQDFNEKINKVDEFFIGIFNDLSSDYEVLKENFRTHQDEIGRNENHNIEDQNILNRLRSFKNHKNLMDSEKYKMTCRFALFHLYKLTHWLEEYCVVNSIACHKIIETFKKKLNCHNLDKECHHHELIDKHKSMKFAQLIEKENELKKNILKLYVHHFCGGSIEEAEKEIKEYLDKSKKRCLSGLNAFWILLGICGVIFIVYFLLTYIPTDKAEFVHSIDVFFPAFNFTFMIIAVFFGFGVNILIFRKHKINYIFLLEIDPVIKLRPFQIFTQAFILFVIWGLLLLIFRISVTYFSTTFYGKFYVFSVTILGIMIIFYFWPLPSLFYRFRICILRTLLNSFIPIGEKAVKFPDFIFADILTSILKPISSLTITFCLFYCPACRGTNSRLHCSRSSHATFVLQMIPFWIRMAQSVNKFYFTKMAFPHLANLGKYFVGVMIVFTQYMWWIEIFSMWVFVAFGIVGYVYFVFWDLYVDWNVISLKSSNKPLRENILYAKWVYYFVIVTNLVLRFFWVFTVLPLPMREEISYFFLSLAEIYRRIQWIALRVENEHISNPEGYRTHLKVPELPMEFKDYSY